MRRILLAAAFIQAIPALAVYPQDHAHPERAPTERLGAVDFPTSCDKAVAHKVDRAVALLHSFEFGASIKAFNEVIANDSTCAIAWWGVALSIWTNPMAPGTRQASRLQQGRMAVEAATKQSHHASERERGYISAVGQLYDDYENRDQRARVTAYEQAMSKLALLYPKDTEAQIFHALSLTASALPTDKTYASQLRAGRILESLFKQHPNHPGLAHYIIHTYDYPPLAARARAAAQRYSSIAPSAAHALHMPSHTFTRVGLWNESIDVNKRSMDVAIAGGSIAEALHAADYAMYAYLQLDSVTDARAILDRLPALAANFDPTAVTGAAPGSAGLFALAAIPARWALERRAWPEAAKLEARPTAFAYTEAMTYFARALGGSRIRDLAVARAAVDSLAAIQRQLESQGEEYWATQVGIQHLSARAWLALAEGRGSEALVQMREAVGREDATEKSAVSPGPLAPARELLGDMLLELGRPAEAKAEYAATLKKEPNRRHARQQLACLGSR